MGFTKNPLSWIIVGIALLFVAFRLYTDVQAGDGPLVAIGIGVAVVIVVVLLLFLNRSGAGELEGVRARRPGSLVKPIIPATAAIQVMKQWAKSQGLKARGTLTAQVASFDREAVTIWTGGREPKVCVSLPSVMIRGIAVQQLREGMRTYNAVALLVDDQLGLLVAVKGRDEALQPAVWQIADAVGLDRSLITFA